jgi:coiled-coil domain-containing protein 55
MSTDKKGRAYGLIKKGETSKAAATPSLPVAKKPSIFNNDSSDEEDGGDWRKRSLAQVTQTKVKKQTKLEMSRALEEDPTVYQYDEVYEAMEADKAEKSASAAEKKKNQVRFNLFYFLVVIFYFNL